MGFKVTYTARDRYVLVRIDGDPTLDEFLGILQEVGADSVAWPEGAVLVDLRGITTPYSFTEQLRIGQGVARNLAHLRKVAALAAPERITRVGEKSARHHGVDNRVFAQEDDAASWFAD